MFKAFWCLIGATCFMVAAPEPEPQYHQGINTLARHDLLAQFVEIRHQPCLFKTSLCPDRCGHACDVAVLKTAGYFAWEKFSKYGEAPQGTFYYKVSPAKTDEATDEKIQNQLKGLQPGQWVKLEWEHQYLVNDHGSYPARPITHLTLLTPEAAKALQAKVDPKISFLAR